MTNPIWLPKDGNTSNMAQFMSLVGMDNYPALYQWSINHPEQFWLKLVEYCQLIFQKKWDAVLTNANQMPGAKWFSGAELNFAENLLRHKNSDKTAIIFINENSERVELTFKQLTQQVAQVAKFLQSSGVGKGDRVAGYLPNRPETVVAMLATASLGATWSSCSLDFGFDGVFERFHQIEPKVLFVGDGHFYNGKNLSASATIKKLRDNLSSVKKIVMINNSNIGEKIPGVTDYSELLQQQAQLQFTPVPFDQPLYIMFSSGTTGAPKCIVHGVGGTLIQHAKELILHTDLCAQDTIFYYTTCGWMMWNWLVSSLMTGATVVLYDGAPMHPNADRLFDVIDAENISVFGTSAKYLTAIEKAGCTPLSTHQLKNLRTILSTGSPLVPQNYRYVADKIKHDVQLSSISGGTDIISCFALGNPVLPVFIGELQCRGLGMKVEVYDDNGQSVIDEKGELVCTAPFPAMPLYFWNDPDNSKYHHAYFEKFAGVWAHGDYAKITKNNGVIIYGRSDTVLNPGGVRVGTAEIYREVEKIDSVLEAIAVGQPYDDDVRIILFVVLKNNLQLDDQLKDKIRANIKHNVSPHHVPKKIIQVKEIPRTVSGKIVELAVRNVVMNQPVKNIDALANPEALENFKNIAELQ